MSEAAAGAPAVQGPPGDEARKGKWTTAQIVVAVIVAGTVFMFFAVAVLGVLAAIAIPNFVAARERANLRACFANQKVLAGAIEMYQLDTRKQVGRIDPALLEALKDASYLQSIPDDPGAGKGTSDHYVVLLEDGSFKSVACVRHGAVSGSGSPRQDLIDGGIRDSALLEKAEERVPGGRRR